MPGSIKIDDGSGNYTILTNAGSLGSDKTLTIPNETGTLNLQSGSVLQVVVGTDTKDNGNQITETSFQDTGLSASITPSSTSSKILVIVTHQILVFAPGTIPFANLQLLRDSTTINLGSSGHKADDHPSDNNAYIADSFSFCTLDSPSSTSSLTYKTQAKYAGSGSGYVYTAYYGDEHIQLIEIGG